MKGMSDLSEFQFCNWFDNHVGPFVKCVPLFKLHFVHNTLCSEFTVFKLQSVQLQLTKVSICLLSVKYC